MSEQQKLPIATQDDIVRVRQAVRASAVQVGLNLIDQTKLVTAASEIARNTLTYGGGGEMILEKLQEGLKSGVRLVFADSGPGIPNVEQALRDGFTTGGGLGLGLGGARRLVDDFNIDSKPGAGTRVTITRWKS